MRHFIKLRLAEISVPFFAMTGLGVSGLGTLIGANRR